MARKQVLEVVCDRCKRVETQEIKESPRTAPGGESKEVVIRFNSRTIEYEDLCIRCRKAVEGYIKQIAKEVEKPKEPTAAKEPERKKPVLLGRSAS